MLGVTCDVGRRASVVAMVEKTVATFSKVDGIVNNAMGIPPSRALTETTEELLDVSLNSGVKGTLWGMLAVYPHIKKAGWGGIVNVGSSAGLVGTKGFGPYAAKEAIRALTGPPPGSGPPMASLSTSTARPPTR
jgi:2-hydroxycyclohexanecarboxyl-CoA dehydrogenase